MPETINLIPFEERYEQTKVKVVKSSAVLSVILFILAAGISAYYYYQAAALKVKIQDKEAEIGNLRSKIQELASVEINARNLDKKYNALSTIFVDRPYYSLLLDKFRENTPASIYIQNLNYRGETSTLTIDGLTDEFILLSDFSDQLLAAKIGDKQVFTNVEIRSVNSSQRFNKIEFNLVVTFNQEALKKP